MMTPELAKFIAEELRDKPVAGWHIGKMLGKGGTAVVFEAQKDGAEAALKVYSKDLVNNSKAKHLERINRQLTLRGHNHPNLVHILDAGECASTGYLFVVMELLRDQTLAEILTDVPRDKIRFVINQIAQAAFYLHQREFVHRDIKPSNIAVSSTTFHSKLLDLGVVRPVTGDTITDDSSGRRFLGTKRYSPPEFFARAEQHNPHAWQAITFYQLGAVLHDLIMQRRLFDGIDNADHELEQAILFQTPQVSASDVPADLVQLANDCLQKQPQYRLRFVTWDRFLRNDAVNTTANLEEVLQRLAARRATDTGTLPSRALVQKRELESAITSLQQAVDSSIRAICIGSAAFPPMTLEANRIGSDASLHRATFKYDFASRPSFYVSILVYSRVLDSSAMAVEIELAASLSTTLLTDVAAPPLRRPVFGGTFNQGSIQDALTRTLPVSLESALQQAERISPQADATETFLPLNGATEVQP